MTNTEEAPSLELELESIAHDAWLKAFKDAASRGSQRHPDFSRVKLTRVSELHDICRKIYDDESISLDRVVELISAAIQLELNSYWVRLHIINHRRGIIGFESTSEYAGV